MEKKLPSGISSFSRTLTVIICPWTNIFKKKVPYKLYLLTYFKSRQFQTLLQASKYSADILLKKNKFKKKFRQIFKVFFLFINLYHVFIPLLYMCVHFCRYLIYNFQQGLTKPNNSIKYLILVQKNFRPSYDFTCFFIKNINESCITTCI